MSAFLLKILACITMFIDHIGYVIFGNASWFNYIGRLAFPIFSFQISEGYIHSHNKKQYFTRLVIFALISQLPFMLFTSIISSEPSLNVIFTLAFGFSSILMYDKFNLFIGISSTILFGLCAQLLNCDYGFYGVAIIFLFYIFRNHKILMAFSFIVATILNYVASIIPYLSYAAKIAIDYYVPYAICTCLAIIPILFYNKKKGYNTKYLLYLFYPLHMLLIYGISLVL